MSRPHEHIIDSQSMIVCDITEEDASFDHELGTEKLTSHRVRCCYIVTYIGGMEFDVTKYFEQYQPKMLEQFKSEALESYLAQL